MMASRHSSPQTIRRRKTVPSFTVAVALTTVIALAAVAVPVLLLRPEKAAVARPTLTVESGAVDIVPAKSPAARRLLVAEIRRFLRGLYQRAFIPPDESQSTPSPVPLPTSRINDLFTSRARDSLRVQPDVFVPGRGFRLDRGRLTFDGVANVDRAIGNAFLNVAFDANGHAKGWTVVLHQKGRLLLTRTAEGWLVSGFELRLEQTPVTPSPSAPDAG